VEIDHVPTRGLSKPSIEAFIKVFEVIAQLAAMEGVFVGKA
jgi:hypothetical protein